jgi:ubiquinone/menaquinone biosynthesis C-methylase UbiE
MISWKSTSGMIKNNKKKTSLKVIFNLNETRRGFRYWILSSLLSVTRTHLLNMIDLTIEEKPSIIDVGCNIGYITRPLSLLAETIGLDIDRDTIRSTKKCNRQIEFVCCDLCHLPLRQASVNIAVCASVLEHIENLEQALKEISFVLKKRGKMVAGYPIETRLLQLIFKSFYRSESPTWDQHNIMKHKERLRDPRTHKQSYSDIRKMLEKYFSPLKKEKIPKDCFPDFLSIYENVILARNEDEIEVN